MTQTIAPDYYTLRVAHAPRSNIRFTIVRDSGCDYSVCEDTGTYSFMTVPVIRERNGEIGMVYYDFGNLADAQEQVRRLHAFQKNGGTIRTRNIDTPDRFEAVADTVYGPAW